MQKFFNNVSRSVVVISILAIGLHHPLCAQDSGKFNLDQSILKILNDHHVPGAAVAVVSRDSVIWVCTRGRANVKDNVPVDKNTLFTIGSISKTFLSAAAMVAQEKGMIDIKTPLTELVPSLNFHNRWGDTHPVRLVHLLEHTSGFDEAHFNLFPHANSTTPFNEVMALSRKSLVNRWTPGDYFEYNTLGYVMAAHVIEENTGIAFEDFVKENLLQPLAMNNATYHPSDSTMEFSKGYEGTSFKEVPFPNIPQWPAGMLTANIEDIAGFVIMLLNHGQFKGKSVLTAASVRRMEIPESSLLANAGIHYGYGKGIWGKIEDGHLFYGHTGRAGGFLSEFGYSRELDIGYVILINNADGSRAIKDIKRAIFSSLGISPKQIPIEKGKPKISHVSHITGCYQPITSVPQLGQLGYFIYRLIDMPIIKEENGHLNLSTMLGDKERLVHVENLTFRKNNEPIATSVFIETQKGEWQWLTDEASYRQIPGWWGYSQFFTAVVCILIIVSAFIIQFFRIPILLIKKKKHHAALQALPFLAICSLLGMIISIITLYDPEEMFSAGAILFWGFGWLFVLFSFLALIKITVAIYRKARISAWNKNFAIATTLACGITSTYLWYWGIIGLKLWSY
jgi:CubicO group peptidase (beta-lactamase class C family)